MRKPLSGLTVGSLIVLAALTGPTASLLHELDIASLGPGVTLWPIFVIVLTAALGIMLSLWLSGNDFRILRWLAVISNGLVLLFYGFLLLFFGLGGSR